MSSKQYDLLGRSNVSWICRKCDSVNVDSFTYHSYTLDLENSYQVLNSSKTTVDTPAAEMQFTPSFFSSPHNIRTVNGKCKCNNNEPSRRKSFSCTKECCRRNLRLSSTGQARECCSCNLPVNVTRSTTHSSTRSTNRGTSEEQNQQSTTHGSTSQESTQSSLGNLVPDKANNWRTLIVNCRSIKANSSSLSTALGYIKPDCIVGTESWLNAETHTSEVLPDDYITYRNDRKDGYGGAFVAIKNTFNSTLVQSEGENSNIVWAEVELKHSSNMYIGSYYRAPSSPVESIYDLNDSLSNLPSDAKTKNIAVGGDFNTPDVDWNIPTVKEGAKNKTTQEELIQVSTQHELKQIQDKPTRGNAILDLYFTNNPSLIKYTDAVPGISDHEMVIVDQMIKPKYNKQRRRKIYKFHQADWAEVRSEAAELNEEILKNIQTVSVDESWRTFKEGMLGIMNKLIPSKLSTKRYNLPWLNRSLKKLIKKKHKLWSKARRTKSDSDWDRYRKHKSHTQKVTRAAHQKYISNILEESMEHNDTKPFWHYIKSKRKDNIGISPLKDQGVLHADSIEKAELLNEQFQSVFTIEDNSNIPEMKGPSFPPIDDIEISEEGVLKLLLQIKVSKASGPDGIPNKMLKETAHQIAPSLSAIFRRSLSTGELPTDWCEANIAPVFKKGNRHLPVNYRPVSLTCVCCKLLEHIICRHIINHLEHFNILTILQHGFRKGFSCVTQLITTLHDIMQLYDKKHQIDVAILDFSKAFDTVPHKRLLRKLHHYGVRGNVLKWIEGFLTNRTQRVLVEGEFSKSAKVLSGVPQGTVLGPLMFLCFINDLPSCVKSQVRLFADDCLLYRPIKSEEDHTILQQDLANLESWANEWGMRFNAQKCYILRISRSKNPSEHFYNLNNHVLEQVKENPYLGVLISEDLKWAKHINKVSRKANSTLAFLRRNLKQCPNKLKLTAYKSLIRSVLEYSCTLWDPHLQKDIQELEKIQRKSARFIVNDHSRESSVTAMLTNLGLPKLEERRRSARLVLFHQIINGLVAIPADDILTCNSRRTRNQGYLQPRCNTTTYQQSFFPRTIKSWNSLPQDIKSIQTLDDFKQALT